MKKLAPIVLFVYNRPWHTKQTIEALQKNELANESELFIYSDAPKNKEVEERVKEVRKYIKTVKGFKKVTIIEREGNCGLAKSIIDGVTEIVNKYGKVIVLEDDLVTSPYFLRFMNDALEVYKDIEKVMHISGYVYPINNKGLDDTYFIKPASCWSWATWDRAWRYFKKDVDYYIETFDDNMIKDFNLNNSYDYFSQIIANKKGKINTWAIFWYASIYLKDGLSLHPKESFVRNIGHDGEGVHCGTTSVFDVKLIKKYPIRFTTDIKEHIKARKRFEKYFNKIKLHSHKKESYNRMILLKILKILGIYNFSKKVYRKINEIRNCLNLNFTGDKNLEEFNRLYDKWGKYKRYLEIKNVNFLSYSFDIPDLPSFVWQFKELFVDELYRFEIDSKEPIIYDCGANIGMSCLYFKILYPNAKIKAFEADPKIAKILKTNLAKNKVLDNVEIINSAVWIDDKGIEFSSDGADGGSVYGDTNKIKMKSIRLKEFLEKEEKIDMLKIDIEGAEYEILKDCKNSLKNVKRLFVEYHSWNKAEQKLSEILEIFEKNGFRYYIENLTHRKNPFINKGELENMDLQLNIFGIKR